MDIRVVNTELLNGWISENGPNGLEKLSLRAEISSSTIAKARAGEAPKRPSTRKRLAEAMGLKEHKLFPVAAVESEAS